MALFWDLAVVGIDNAQFLGRLARALLELLLGLAILLSQLFELLLLVFMLLLEIVYMPLLILAVL